MGLKIYFGLAFLVIALALQVKCDENDILRPDSADSILDIGQAEGQRSRIHSTAKAQVGPPPSQFADADSDLGSRSKDQRRSVAVDTNSKAAGAVVNSAGKKSPASHSAPDPSPEEEELEDEEEYKKPVVKVEQAQAEENRLKGAAVVSNDIDLTVDDPNILHAGSHDLHHPLHGVAKGREHDVQAFHPGLDKRMGDSSDDGEHEPSDEIPQKETEKEKEVSGAENDKDSGSHHQQQQQQQSQQQEKQESLQQGADTAQDNELPVKFKPEDPLPSAGNKTEQTVDEDSFTHDKVHEKPETKKDEKDRPPAEVENTQPFTLFTIANTDIGTEYSQLPYREKYQWQDRNAPCHSFNLKIPDELLEKSIIILCIFRPSLEFTDETKQFIMNFEPTDDKKAPQKVFGYVMNTEESTVYGKVVDRYFYGEVSILDKETNQVNIYVAEEIILLNRLMRNNMKTLRNMLMVMHAGSNITTSSSKDKPLVYNAVVTKGASLINFMMYTNPNDVNRNPFLMFSTNHNSYISAGEPHMKVDDNGEVQLASGSNKIQVVNDGSVRLSTATKEYTFRPNGRTIVREGMTVRTLQEHEGSVAVTAYSSASTYDCVLPTPAFQVKRKGGYVCKVCLALDDLFIQHYLVHRVKENEMAQDYMARIIDRVAWIFRSKDLDGDKRPDNVGVDFDAQPAHWSYPNVGNEDLDDQSIEILFQSLEEFEFADCCLGIGYTMKKLPDNALGKRPTAKQNGPSGICSGRTGRIANNLIIISANSHKGNFSAITEDQLIYLTANQVGGAFGANPDGTGDDVCDQFIDEKKKTRHYLMWPDVLRNASLSEQRLSTCSKGDIVKTLSTCKSSCFDIDKHPFCGNGIVEEGEECDCGSEQNCALQSCCFSRIGKHPCRKSGVGCKPNSGSSLTTGITEYAFIIVLTILAQIF